MATVLYWQEARGQWGHCTLYTVHCTLYTVDCTLYSVNCTLYTVNCTLYTVHCVEVTFPRCPIVAPGPDPWLPPWLPLCSISDSQNARKLSFQRCNLKLTPHNFQFNQFPQLKLLTTLSLWLFGVCFDKNLGLS